MKRLFDLAVSLWAAFAFWWVFLLLALLVRCRLGSPIFFRQTRPGRYGKPFTIIKFRTMLDACDKAGKPLPDCDRLTPFGRILRSTSLDELPELWNVIKGDMSLVGPRPLLMQYLDRYTPRQARRHDVRPGITGWAQVNGRNTISWEEKFELDLWYIKHQSFILDLKILCQTFLSVFRREDVCQPGHATTNEFMGSGDRDK
jgi:lipopolysaccharide/colanic/teichoic acid biosynthesis glycosyltransferase